MFDTLQTTELIKMLEGLKYSLLLIVIMNLIIIAFLFFCVFILPLANKEEADNQMHEKAKAIIEKENSQVSDLPLLNELGLSVMCIDYDTMPEEWEQMWYALEQYPDNNGWNVHYASSTTGLSWDYKYTVLSEFPIHLFNHPIHPSDGKSKWVAIPASSNFLESINQLS